MIIRRAHPLDGPAIGKLFQAADWPDLGVDWDRPGIADWWLVAEADGEILGAIQVLAAEPIGYIGELVLHRAVRGLAVTGHGTLAPRGSVVGQALYLAAEHALQQAGVQRVAAALRLDRPGWWRIVARWGWNKHSVPVVLASKELT